MMELFWLPINSITFIINMALWCGFGWIIYEIVQHYRGLR
jgi:hypothetical protein